MRLRTIFSLAVASVAVSACVVSSETKTEPYAQVEQALRFCSDNCDCAVSPHGPVCVDGRCTLDFGPFPECYCAETDCAAGEVCDGSCQPAPNNCANNCDCSGSPYGPVCVSGHCTIDFGPFPECYCAATDCAPGQVCEGTCHAP